MNTNNQALEYIKCKNNFLYFLHNYIKIPETGGSVLYTPDLLHLKFKRTIQCSLKFGRVILMATRQLGKALSLDTPMLLPSGEWTTMGDLKIGQSLIGNDFKPTKIINMTEIMYDHDCYEIKFNNNKRSIRADKDHLWRTVDGLVLTTYDLTFLSLPINLGSGSLITKIVKTHSVPVKCIEVDANDHMYFCGDLVPTHNSTISAALLEYLLNFYPKNRAIILNMSKTAGLENIDRIRFMHDNLPLFLKSPHKNKAADKKTFLEYDNGSKINVFFPSSATSPSTLARSLTSPILYVDECSFIRHMNDAWGAAVPVLAKAREQARKYGYKDLILLSATPNGTESEGKFFYDIWSNAIDSDELYDENNKFIDNYERIINSPTKNGFIAIKYHWSESKDEDWYLNQCKDLNFDARKINQELDLLFVGGTHCLFDDDFLSKLRSEKPVEYIELPHYTKLKIFNNAFDNKDFYLIGVDSARSLTGDFAVIEIYKYSNFEQVAEFSARLGSIVHFADIVKEVIKYIHSHVADRIKVGIEVNEIGGSVVDLLIQDDEFDYIPFLYKTKSKSGEKYGIITGRNKDEMITYLYDYITHNPTLLHSSDLISQLSVIEKKSGGKISAASGHHDDLFMASAFCAYLKKQCQLEISPLINVDTLSYNEKYTSEIQSLLSINQSPSPTKSIITDFSNIDTEDGEDFDESLPFWYSHF